jgi:hypothetical protein
MPDEGKFSSFISTNQFSTETAVNPLICGAILGSTYNNGFTFNPSVGPTANPGGLFGWLIYSRVNRSTPIGDTAAQYIVYTNPQDLVFDLNQLSGISGAIVTGNSGGYTFAFFKNDGLIASSTLTKITPLTNGTDFLFALNYLAYGGNLVIVPNTTGFDQYVTENENYLDAVVAQEAGASLSQWLITQPYTVGIFPSIYTTLNGSSGFTGLGLTMADYATLFGSGGSSLVTGSTVANRIFNVRGIKTVSDVDTTTLLANSQITYNLPSVVDVAGFFNRSKNQNKLYLTVAGIDLSTILNGKITIGSIDWNSALKTTLRTNRVNFFVNASQNFLGSDLTGATANATILSENRIGPANLKTDLTKLLNDIGLKYLYKINNAQTRAQVTAEIQTGLDPFAQFIDTTQTQIICNDSNNTNNGTALTMQVVIKPILSIESLGVTVTLTQ